MRILASLAVLAALVGCESNIGGGGVGGAVSPSGMANATSDQSQDQDQTQSQGQSLFGGIECDDITSSLTTDFLNCIVEGQVVATQQL